MLLPEDLVSSFVSLCVLCFFGSFRLRLRHRYRLRRSTRVRLRPRPRHFPHSARPRSFSSFNGSHLLYWSERTNERIEANDLDLDFDNRRQPIFTWFSFPFLFLDEPTRLDTIETTIYEFRRTRLDLEEPTKDTTTSPSRLGSIFRAGWLTIALFGDLYLFPSSLLTARLQLI